jgi:hypothetical protein
VRLRLAVITTLRVGETDDAVYMDATAAGFGWYTGPDIAFGPDRVALAGGRRPDTWTC